MCDYGLSRNVDEEEDSGLTEYVVTRYYRAPEVMLSSHEVIFLQIYIFYYYIVREASGYLERGVHLCGADLQENPMYSYNIILPIKVC